MWYYLHPFLYYYTKHFTITTTNECLAIYDNLAFVTKLSWLLKDNYNSHDLHESTEQDALKLILKILP